MIASKAQTIEYIKEMPENTKTDELLKAVNIILRNFNGQTANNSEAMQALKNIEDLRKPAPAGFDPEKELMEAMEDRYGHFD